MLDASLSADLVDSTVQLQLSVTNRSDDPVELTFPTGQRAEFTAYPRDSDSPSESSGDPVWRYGEGRLFTQAFGTETLAESESVTYDATWTSPPPGAYRIVGELRAIDLPDSVESTAAVDVMR